MNRKATSFRNGRHLASARAMAGLTQKELADRAGIHVNSVKYLEAKSEAIGDDRRTVAGIGAVLASIGIEASCWPTPYVRLAALSA